jgi:hypothetical protein
VIAASRIARCRPSERHSLRPTTGISPILDLQSLRRPKDTDRAIEINGREMKLFTRRIDSDASLTLGSNADTAPRAANMYVVRVGTVGAPRH